MGKKLPLVSIIIPTKNEEINIERLLTSVNNQTYQNTETVVVDDGSMDNTVQVAKKLASKVFKRTHAERSIQRNFGAKNSKGDFLFFLDADMELTTQVIEECVALANKKSASVITVPERTVGDGILTQVRRFEREMYMGDPSIEVARFFSRSVFFEFGGYDVQLTGPEDYDLPYRMSKKYSIYRATKYILHHEKNVSLKRLLTRKYYYAEKGALYASKHNELIKSQGNLLFRKAYLKHWRKFFQEPLLGLLFICVRVLEAIFAVAGFINAVGIVQFLKVLLKVYK